MQQIELTGLDLNLLLVLEAMLAENHVSRAADRLHLSQAATSHALGRLRRMFADPLFVRRSAGMEPTSRALELARPLAEALAQVRTMVAPARFEPATLVCSYTVATDDYAMTVLLTRLMSLLRQEAPGVELRCIDLPYEHLIASFDRRMIDLACGVFLGPPAQRVECTPLFEDRYVGISRAGHVATTAGPINLQAFVALPHVDTSSDSQMRSPLDKALADLNLSRRIVLTVPSILSIPSVVMESDLIGVMPARLAATIADREALYIFELPFAVDPFKCILLNSNRQEAAPAFRWILDLAKQAVSTFPK